MPASYSNAEMAAVRRYLAGERLGPAAKRSLKKAERKARAHQRYVDSGARDEDFALRQQFYDEEHGARRPGTAGPRAPGGAVTAAPPRPTTGLVGPAGGGAALRKSSSWNANLATADEFHRRLSMMGLDPSFHTVDHATETARATAKSPSLGLRVKEAKLQIDAEKRLAARSAEIERGKLDAKTAPAEQVRRRMEALGIDHQLIASIREPGKELPPLQRVDPFAASLEARRKAAANAKRAKAQSDKGRPPDTRRMDDLTFAEYVKRRGWAGGL